MTSPSDTPTFVPKHLAIIMDGNGRWARARMLPRIEGHRQGAKTVRMVVEQCRTLGIRYLTLYTFSTENWGRPKSEVDSLMRLFSHYLEGEAAHLKKNGVRLRGIGRRNVLPDEVQRALSRCEELTKDERGLDLILAVSYGGRDELVDAVRTIATKVEAGKLAPSDINATDISGALYAPDVPDPDLLIRTSEECRISNFLLWQLAYSEIVVSPLFWPEFSKEELHRCLSVFGKRTRRFGLTQEQVAKTEEAP